MGSGIAIDQALIVAAHGGFGEAGAAGVQLGKVASSVCS